jgi:general secretion pathway protein M
MEPFRRIRAQLEAFFSRLSPRERVMVSAALAAVAAFVLFLAVTGISRSLSARTARIADKTQMLSQLGKLTAGYRQAQAERQALEARLKGPPVQLMSYVSQAGAQVGVEVNDLRPGQPATAEGLQEESVEVNLARIDVPRLARLVEALERGPGIVRVRRLRLSTRNDDPALVDVTLQVSTWQAKAGPEAR